jgi:hypothetical protein
VFVCVAERTIEGRLLSRSSRRWAALNFWTSCYETVTNSSEPSVAVKGLQPPQGSELPLRGATRDKRRRRVIVVPAFGAAHGYTPLATAV